MSPEALQAAQSALIVKILVGAGVLFVIGYIGNLLTFSNRFVNALVTAVVFAAIYAALYYSVDQAMMPPEVASMSQETWLRMIGMAAVLVFVIDLIANMISFNNRIVNALMTALVFAILFTVLLFATGGMPGATVPA